MTGKHQCVYVIGDLVDYSEYRVTHRGALCAIRQISDLDSARDAVISSWDVVQFGKAFYAWPLDQRLAMRAELLRARDRGMGVTRWQ